MGIIPLLEFMIALKLQNLSSVTATLICENTARGAGILGEHGLSWCIEAGDKRVLFDLGQGLSLNANAAKLGIKLAGMDAIVLSHGHYDHLGGWTELAQEAKSVPVFLHPDALQPKYQRRANGRIDPAGSTRVAKQLPLEAAELIIRREPTEVIPGIWMTGEVPRHTKFEDTGGDFVKDPAGEQTDFVNDDQSLFFKTDQGIVVILGCAHAGVINTLQYIQALTEERIHAAVGGMHLLHASPERMQHTIEELNRIAPDWIGPNHCTGDAAVAQLRTAFAEHCLECHAGQSYTFPYAN
jgi:7,8-dihydropterin-6-yl-methyl-4-(beta-D-ribofuranosyl)aminobenzene 5'-phosphate synthase